MTDAPSQPPEAAGPSTIVHPPQPPSRRGSAFESLRSHLHQPAVPLLPDAYKAPEEYLLAARFHSRLSFRPSFVEKSAPAHRLTYASVGSDEPGAPVLLWINGLGGNRLAACSLDGICAEHGVKLYAIDRPGSGGSTSVPLKHRFAWVREAILALLTQEQITNFSLLSHSNGDLYTLHLMLNIPPHLTVVEWILSSPFLPPNLSGSLALTIARYIPAGATGKLGGLISGVMKGTGMVSGLLALSGGLSSGLSGASSGFSTGWSKGGGSGLAGFSSGISTGISQGWAKGAGIAQEKEGDQDDPDAKAEKVFNHFALRQATKEEHRRVFSGRFVPPKVFKIAQEWVLAEGLEAWGEEALVCLRKGGGAGWGWGEAENGEVDEQLLFERGFGALKQRLRVEGRKVKMSVWYGEDDALIPRKGQLYMKELLVDRLELVAEDDFHTLADAGHDSNLSLECMMVPLLTSLKQSAGEVRTEETPELVDWTEMAAAAAGSRQEAA